MSAFAKKTTGIMGVLGGWLVYDTTKIVRIYDKRLALLYYGLVFLIVSYTFYSLIYNKGYFEEEQPVGAVNIHLAPGSTKKQELTKLPYCNEENECIYWDESEILYSLGTKDVLITTHVESDTQELVCSTSEAFGKSCSWKSIPGSLSEYFIAGVESVTIEIDHSAQAPVFHEQWLQSKNIDEGEFDNLAFAGTCKRMEGVLMNPRGDIPKVAASFPDGELDELTVNQLLSASHCDLNDINELTNKTYRHSGLVLDADLAYNNARCGGKISCAFGTVPLHYRYRIYKVPDTQFFHEEFNTHNSTIRNRVVRSGILLKVTQTGKISRFSWNVFFVNFSSGLGLFTLVVIIVDAIAIYILPEKDSYTHRKFSEVASSGEKIKSPDTPFRLENKPKTS